MGFLIAPPKSKVNFSARERLIYLFPETIFLLLLEVHKWFFLLSGIHLPQTL